MPILAPTEGVPGEGQMRGVIVGVVVSGKIITCVACGVALVGDASCKEMAA